MISTLAQLLEELRAAEVQVLKKIDIQHGPTIGSMYEGLTRNILDRGIPPALGLKVVEGFIKGFDGQKSHQSDVLLVRGKGEHIPYTDAFVWDIRNVLAVFEVKKTLLGAELEDAFVKMWKVAELLKKCDLASGYEGKDISFGHKVFAKLTGFCPKYEDVDDLPTPLPIIHYGLLLEQLGPVRVILGYEGYANESTLRKGIAEFLASKGVGPDRAFLSLPSLIICKNNSVVKMNGFPYFFPLEDHLGWWIVMGSNSRNPTRLLLEMLWTKISAEMNVGLPMDDTLQQEEIYPFIRYKHGQRRIGKVIQKGFAMDYYDGVPSDRPKGKTWVPQGTTEIETVTLWQAARNGYVDVHDKGFSQFAKQHKTTARAVLTLLVKKRVLAWIDSKKERARPIEPRYATVFTPSGQTVVSDHRELLSLWLRDSLDSPKTR